MRLLLHLFLFGLCGLAPAAAQQTVFNVPSADVLERGKVYTELDLTFRPHAFLFTATPRLVVGVGHNVEAGLNLSGPAYPDDLAIVLAPTVKWKAVEDARRGWALLLGDSVFVPAHRGAYRLGNYLYASVSKKWSNGTRLGLGAFHYSPGVVAGAQRAGGQFTFEQPLTTRLQFAAEWSTGSHTNGYFNPGFILRVSPKFTFYAAYQVGNRGVTQGNHNLLFELGLNLD